MTSNATTANSNLEYIYEAVFNVASANAKAFNSSFW
jgi:hypothetical protein